MSQPDNPGRLRGYPGGHAREKYVGAAPTIQFNPSRKTDIAIPKSLCADVTLLEDALGIGFFHYGPRSWMFGEIEPLKILQQEGTATERSSCGTRTLYPQVARPGSPRSAVAPDPKSAVSADWIDHPERLARSRVRPDRCSFGEHSYPSRPTRTMVGPLIEAFETTYDHTAGSPRKYPRCDRLRSRVRVIATVIYSVHGPVFERSTRLFPQTVYYWAIRATIANSRAVDQTDGTIRMGVDQGIRSCMVSHRS